MMVQAEAYEQLALGDPDGRWELHDGELRQKPTGTTHHNQVQFHLAVQLTKHLEFATFHWRMDNSRTARQPRSFYIPDRFVVPAEFVRRRLQAPPRLEVYDEPLPLVVEVWSPSTGDYDIDSKLPVYKQRGDLEIWRIHPHERTLIAWRRQPDGSYTETLFTGGVIEPIALPGVQIDIDGLFA